MREVSYRDLGRKRANPYARKDNNLKLDDCPCTADDVCQDILTSATIAGTEVITQVVFNGVTYLPTEDVKTPGGEVVMTAPGTITAADTDELQAWLEAIANVWEFDVYITVEHSSTTLTVEHYGALTLTSITTNAPETITGARCCALVDVFTNTVTVDDGTITEITVDGISSDLDTGAYADGDDLAQLVTDVKAELTALGVAWSDVTATYDADEGEFTIIIISDGRDISIDGTMAINSASSEAFICP